MSKENIFYVQCLLQKKKDNCLETYVTFLPLQYAKKGKILKLKSRGQESWDDGWVVTDVYLGSLCNEEMVTVQANQYRFTREVSDI